MKWGGDFAEDVNGGMQRIEQLKWSNLTKCVIHISDSPPHGSKYNNCSDHYKRGAPNDKPFPKMFKVFHKKGIDYTYFHIRKALTSKMFS